MRLPIPPSPLQVWAVEDTSVQLTWGDLPPGVISATAHAAGGAGVATDHIGGPGSLDLTGLEPGANYQIEVSWPDGGRAQLHAQTVPSPPGRLLSRVATVSDLHLGATKWGLSKLMHDRSGAAEPFPLRCARAAITDAVTWGADLLVIKGDAVHHQDSDHFAQLALLLDDPDVTGEVPVLLIPGNHEVDGKGDCELPAEVGRRGSAYVRGAACEDLPGLRVIVADTTIAGAGRGTIDPVADDICELAGLSPGPFLLCLHHQLQRYRYPTYYPAGIAAPASTEFLEALAAANPSGLVTSGHTHRNRTRYAGTLPVTEVGATRDWPGGWAGYAVHEGGIRQVVRRAATAEAMAWHEYSSNALLSQWRRWAAGPLPHRCFTHPWPT